VPVDQRIATFDNDGTLWVEQPMYVQLAFILDPREGHGADASEWKTKQPFAAVLDGDLKALAASGERGLVELVAVTHAGMTTAEFEKLTSEWLATSRASPLQASLYGYWSISPCLSCWPTSGQRLQTFIASGGGIEFMRPWTERIYRNSTGAGHRIADQDRFEMRDTIPVLFRLADINFIDDKAASHRHQRAHRPAPIAAFGNSDGDLEMLQWTTLGADGARFRPDRPSYRRGAGNMPTTANPISVSSTSALDAAAVNKCDRGRHEERLEAHLCLRLADHDQG
jgi:hypothetical protein